MKAITQQQPEKHGIQEGFETRCGGFGVPGGGGGFIDDISITGGEGAVY